MIYFFFIKEYTTRYEIFNMLKSSIYSLLKLGSKKFHNCLKIIGRFYSYFNINFDCMDNFIRAHSIKHIIITNVVGALAWLCLQNFVFFMIQKVFETGSICTVWVHKNQVICYLNFKSAYQFINCYKILFIRTW